MNASSDVVIRPTVRNNTDSPVSWTQDFGRNPDRYQSPSQRMVIPNNRKSKKSYQKHLRNKLEVYVWHWSQCLQCLSVILTIPCSLLLGKRASGAGIRVKEGQSLCWMYWTVPVAQVLPNYSTTFVSMKETYRCVALGDSMACIQAL